MEPLRREYLTWENVDNLIGHLLPQFDVEYEGMILVTRGGIIPGGLLAQALDIKRILTASVDFPKIENTHSSMKRIGKLMDAGLYAWPQFLQFPEIELLHDKRLLIVDDVWGSGRTIMAVRSRIESSGGVPYTCVLHYNPNTNRFMKIKPDYFAAITDAYIVYPWESDRGFKKVLTGELGRG